VGDSREDYTVLVGNVWRRNELQYKEAEAEASLRCIKRHGMNEYRGMTIPLIHFICHWIEVGGQLHAPAALPPGKKLCVSIRSFDTRLGGLQSWSGQEEKNPLPEVEPLSFNLYSKSL
jgi:hypothetical protein